VAALLGLVALTVCAVIATASWSAEAASRSLVEREHAVALAGWGGLSAVASVVMLATGDVAHPAGLALLLLGALGAAIGVAGAARLATLTTGLAPAAAEAALVGASLVSIFWVIVGAPAAPGPRALAFLTLTTIDLMAAALIVRVPVVSRNVALDRRYRPVLATGVAALCCLGVGDGLMTLTELGDAVPAGLGLAVRAVAYLIAAAVPWVPQGAVRPIRRPAKIVRALPYLLVALAVATLLVAGFVGRVGPVSLVFVALVVCGLATGQGVALRENAMLLRESERSRGRLVALVENVTDVVLGIDSIGRVESANAAASRLLHRTPEAMAGLDVGELAIPEHRAALRLAVDDVVHGRRASDRVEVRLAAPATGTAELRMQAVPGGAVANLSDITEAVQLRERLERLARFDEMTGLANRAQLLGEITSWLRAGLPVTVLYCDLDGFKAVNDRFGHLCGDNVLAEAARRLRGAAVALPGERTLVARIGGDEFVVALVRAPQEQLPVATERLLSAMRPTFQVADRAVRVGLSIGVATTEDEVRHPRGPRSAQADRARSSPATDDCDADELLHRADVAMFAAKQAGRFRSMRWDAAMEARALRRVDIAIGLRRALDSHRLALAYQPLVRLSDGAVIGVEALLRVEPADDAPGALAGLPELVSPAELVAVAEDTGEMTEMGHWVITEATLQAARWRALGHDVLMTVNVSVRQMAADGFVEFVRDALATARLPAARLVVEITEGQLLSEADPAWSALEQLRAMGVMLVIDDFGSGYSSLAYLRRMPVRGVKLDRALLDDLTTDPRARTLARAVIAAARALGLLVVAEGLETLDSARVVRDLGAYAGQGFALFQAMPADEVAAVLASPPAGLGAGQRHRRPIVPEPEPTRSPAPEQRPAVEPRAESGPDCQPASIDLRDHEVHESVRADLR
jgi:diguanylate cyclase (GGDEF)-like protein